MKVVRVAIISLAVTAIMTAQALSADVSGPLAPGKPAGVHQAQTASTNLWLAAGVGAVVAAIVAVTASTSGISSCGPKCTSMTIPATTTS